MKQVEDDVSLGRDRVRGRRRRRKEEGGNRARRCKERDKAGEARQEHDLNYAKCKGWRGWGGVRLEEGKKVYKAGQGRGSEESEAKSGVEAGQEESQDDIRNAPERRRRRSRSRYGARI